jgi:hypothetical protein
VLDGDKMQTLGLVAVPPSAPNSAIQQTRLPRHPSSALGPSCAHGLHVHLALRRCHSYPRVERSKRVRPRAPRDADERDPQPGHGPPAQVLDGVRRVHALVLLRFLCQRGQEQRERVARGVRGENPGTVGGSGVGCVPTDGPT